MEEDPTTDELDHTDAPFVEIYPDEILPDPNTQPKEFFDFCRQRLVEIGVGLPTSEQEIGLYKDIDLMIFCGLDGSDLQKNKTFGERRETWGVTGEEFGRMTRDASEFGKWATASTVSYAMEHAQAQGKPAIAVFDGAKMKRIINSGDTSRHEEEYAVADGFTMDQAAIAVFYLPS
jgi:hypothetical protein